MAKFIEFTVTGSSQRKIIFNLDHIVQVEARDSGQGTVIFTASTSTSRNNTTFIDENYDDVKSELLKKP